MVNTLNELTKDDMTGVIAVLTSSGSKHIFDFTSDEWHYYRLPGDGTVSDYPVSELRKDNSTVKLKLVETCSVGESAIFLLHGVNDDDEISTVRMTTPVVSIERIS